MKVKTMIEVLGMPLDSTQEQITEELNRLIAKCNNAYAGWTLEDFLENDVEALKEILANDPERLERLNSMDLNERVGEYTRKELAEIGDKRIKRKIRKDQKLQLMSLSEEEREEFKKDYPKEYKSIMNSQ